MKLLFITSAQYPDGGASANRHMAYGKGLVEAGHEVIFLLLSKQVSSVRDYCADGIYYQGAYIENPSSNRNIFNKVDNHFRKLRTKNDILLDSYNKRKIDAIIILDSDVWVLISTILWANKHKVKLFHERTEYPFVVAGKGLRNKVYLKIYLSVLLKRFDGIYVINEALRDYLNQLLNKRLPIEIINMIVDDSRFDTVSDTVTYNNPYIAYCGSINDDKDGVHILVESFCNALSAGNIDPETRLLLIGDFKQDGFLKNLQDILVNKRCINNAVFTGRVERSVIPPLLNNASALVLARPESKQAEGGFPTKLGEYLATGKPVIVTDVGEIGKFLKDGYNAFLAKPGDVKSFTNKIAQVFSDYKEALKIGQQGKLLIYNDFNYYKQAMKLARFIEDNL